jgi:hypothetical protein
MVPSVGRVPMPMLIAAEGKQNNHEPSYSKQTNERTGAV